MTRTALVSGAGIAGPTLAYWLVRQGFTVTVVESAPGPRPGGQTVDLRGAGRTIIERMGLMPAVRAACMEQEGLAYVDAEGHHLAEMRVADLGGDGIVSELEILRGDLARILLDATTDCEYLFGTRVTALDDGTATLSDGTVREFDVIVGADGPHSGIRRLAFGPEERFVRPIGGYTAWFTAPDPVGLEGWYRMYNEPGRVASARPDSVPGRAKAGLSFLSEPLEYDRRDVAAQKALVAERMAGMGWRTPQLVEGMHAADDFYLDLVAQVRMDHWTTGRVALVGDAGYCPSPLTGLGTSLALVGAYVLAGELGRHDSVAEAFAAYEERMRPYVAQAQELPPGGIRGYAPPTHRAIRRGIVMMRLMVSRPLRGLTKRLFFSKAEAIDLPDYSCTNGTFVR
ncbi:FAD-dependent monooxygenase [Pseudonocardia xishanensis]|uniref:FAD-dependent monooxygenase n=1 Tax=Pseudonocardia xishanensis TaxID=630995 RepID=A0ABP8RHD4_9PSEU